MNAADLLTERQAAEKIGWSAAGLRSHRERHELALLAEGLPEDLREVVRKLEQKPRRGLADLSVEPWRLTKWLDLEQAGIAEGNGAASSRPTGARQALNARGIEVSRALRFGRRPTEPPPHIWTELGVRYSEADLAAWLDRHPAAQDRAEMLTEQQVSELLGLELSTLKTLRYRARLAAERLAVLPKAKSRRKSETREEYETRKAQLAHEERVVDGLPKGHKVGRVYRYRREDVDAWLERHPDRGPHPRLVERDPKRGALLGPAEVAARMRLQPQSLVGYRCRAGAAARKLGEISQAKGRRKGETAEEYEERQQRLAQLRGLADCVPPHVLVDGEVLYQARDVAEWERRQRRGEMETAATRRASA